MTGIIDGQTNSASDVNIRSNFSNGDTDGLSFIDTTNFDVKTVPYVDASSSTLSTVTLEKVSIKELSNMNSTSDVEYWAESSDANNPTYQTTITYIKEGTGSGSFDWTYSGGTAIWTNTQNYGNLSTINDYVSMWCYITSACYSALSTNGVRIAIGSDSSNYLEFYFPKVNLRIGWNYLECVVASPDGTGGSIDWTGIDWNRIKVYETASSTIYFDNFKVYKYGDTQISGSTIFMYGRTTDALEGKSIVTTIHFGGENYAGFKVTGGY